MSLKLSVNWRVDLIKGPATCSVGAMAVAVPKGFRMGGRLQDVGSDTDAPVKLGVCHIHARVHNVDVHALPRLRPQDSRGA